MYFSAIDGLKKLYKSKILPVEEMYKFGSLNSPSLSCDGVVMAAGGGQG